MSRSPRAGPVNPPGRWSRAARDLTARAVSAPFPPSPVEPVSHRKLDIRRTIGGQESREPQGWSRCNSNGARAAFPIACIAIVAALGLYLVIGVIAWAMFISRGVAVPESFATILATIAGGLVGALTPTAGPARSSEPRREERPPPPAE
jgi:hypothetical protein